MEKLWVTPTGATADSLAAFNFETEDVFGFQRHLKAEGVLSGEVRTFQDRSALFHFTDPDDYTLMIWGCNQCD